MTFQQRRMLALFIVLIAIGALLLAVLLWSSDSAPGRGSIYEKAEVISITSLYSQSPGSTTSFNQQSVRLEILSGQHRGETIETINTVSGNPLVDVDMSQGSAVLVNLHEENGQLDGATIAGNYRLSTLIALSALVMLLVALIGGAPGIKSLVVVLAVLVSLFKVMLPAIIAGSDPVAMLILVVAGLSVFITIINNGFNLISLTALAGTLTSCLLASLAAHFLLDSAGISGFASIESRMGYYMENFSFDMRMLLFCGIVLSSLGAVTEICQAVAASISDHRQAFPEASMNQLFMAGIKYGRQRLQDLIAILCMAFCGVLVPWLAFYLAYSDSLTYIMNTELVAGEVIRLLVCYLCLGLALPFTAFYSLALHIGLERRHSPF